MRTDEWRTVRLGDVADDVTVGHVGPMATEYINAGIPFLRSLNIEPHRIDLTGVKFVSPEFHARLKKSALKPGDVVTVRTGKPGATAVVPDHLPEANCSDVVVTRPGPNLDPRWLSYYINGVASEYISSRLVGAVQQHFNVGSAKEMLLALPPLGEQSAIAATLGALDDKIESNRRIIELVPGLIRARVCAGLDVGSNSVAVADLAEFVNGGAYTRGASGTGRMVIRIAELNSGPGGSTVFNNIDVPEDRTARPGDILMAWSGSLGVHRWVLDEAIVNQHIFKVTPAAGYPAWLVFDRLDEVMPIFRGIAKDKATTMGHIQRGHLNSTSVDVPQPEAIADLDTEIAPIWDRLLVSERENLVLAELRDSLLPELLSGRVRVPEAEQAMAEAAT
jgi:type I restriction enzyme S subunit